MFITFYKKMAVIFSNLKIQLHPLGIKKNIYLIKKIYIILKYIIVQINHLNKTENVTINLIFY